LYVSLAWPAARVVANKPAVRAAKVVMKRMLC
jgi:hypothetical protein